jgi:MFS transporter, DHA2 family, multidrug resistance protein
VVLVALLVPESRTPNPGRLDPIGVLMSVAGLVLLVYGIIKGGEHGSVSSPEVWATGLAGIAILALFIAYERRTDHPALDVRLFRNPNFSASITAVGMIFFSMMGVLFFMTFYLQFVRGYSPLETGLLYLPFAGAQLVFSPLSGGMVNRLGVRTVTALGLGLVTLSLAALGFVGADTSLWAICAIFFVQGVGIANVMPPVTTAIMGAVPRERAGVGSAMNNTMRQVGGALGVAVLGSVLAVSYRDAVTPALVGLPSGARDAAAESLGSTLAVAQQAAQQAGPQAMGQIRDAAFVAFVDGMHAAAFIAAAVAFLSTLVVLRFLPGKGTAPALQETARSAQPGEEAVEVGVA